MKTTAHAWAKDELHKPDMRPLMACVGGWELRGEGDAASFEDLRRGLLHLQLWHAASGTSLLTPNNLTGAAFEVRAACGRRFWPRTRAQLRHVFRDHLRMALPWNLVEQASDRVRRLVDVEMLRLAAEAGWVADTRCPGRDFSLGALALQSAALQQMCGVRS